MMLTITIPAALYQSASAIMRALDPDVGGALSFGAFDPEAESYTTGMPCCESCLARAADPVALHEYVVANYATRWPDMAVPTLEDCEAFSGCLVTENA